MNAASDNLFKKLISHLIQLGATTPQKSEHWPMPENEEAIFATLLAEGISPKHIAQSFAQHKGWTIYEESMGEFTERGRQWGIADNTLYITNPFATELEELLDKQNRGALQFEEIGLLVADETEFVEDTDSANTTEMDQTIDKMLEDALARGASDIHISPRTSQHLSIQFRIDGVRTVYQHDIAMKDYPAWSNRLLGKADQMGGKPNQPLTLKFSYAWKNRDTQIRMEAIPVIQTGKRHYYFVLRLLNPTGSLRKLEDIGFPHAERDTLEMLCRSPKGLIIVTGPTGSGKTTTLYAILQRIQEVRPGDSIQTLEDPVEVEIQGIEQTEINKEMGMTFNAGLRSKLRQDPDVILVGELRDLETAELAVEASMTGHLVLATLHTNNAVQAISRLSNLGVEPSTLADSLLAVTAQRMVRNVCHKCSKEVPFGEDRKMMERYGSLDKAPEPYDMIRVANLEGCSECEGGYKGRSLVSELMIIDPWTQSQIIERAPASRIEDEHKRHKYRTLWDNGIELAKKQITTFDELESRLSPFANYGQHFSYGRETNLL